MKTDLSGKPVLSVLLDRAGLKFVDGVVWVGTTGSNDVYWIDPATNVATGVQTGATGPAWFSSQGDVLWVSNVPGGTVSRLDPSTGSVTATVKTGTQPVDGAVGPDGLVWIPNLGDGTVSRIDPAAGKVSTTFQSAPRRSSSTWPSAMRSPDYGGNLVSAAAPAAQPPWPLVAQRLRLEQRRRARPDGVEEGLAGSRARRR